MNEKDDIMPTILAVPCGQAVVLPHEQGEKFSEDIKNKKPLAREEVKGEPADYRAGPNVQALAKSVVRATKAAMRVVHGESAESVGLRSADLLVDELKKIREEMQHES